MKEMGINNQSFEKLKDSTSVDLCTLSNANDIEAAITPFHFN